VTSFPGVSLSVHTGSGPVVDPQRESEGLVSGPKGRVPWWVRGPRSRSPRDSGGQDPRGRLGGPPRTGSEERTGSNADRQPGLPTMGRDGSGRAPGSVGTCSGRRQAVRSPLSPIPAVADFFEGPELSRILRIAHPGESRWGAGEPTPTTDLVGGPVLIANCSRTCFQVVESRALGHRPQKRDYTPQCRLDFEPKNNHC
jgi:hypothetical protein